MKRHNFISILAAALLILASSASACASLTPSSSTASSSTQDDKLSGLGSILGNALKGVLSTDKVSVDALKGSWKYNAPAVSFKSDNLLKKAGGVAVAAAAEQKIAPYYKKTGLDKMALQVNADSTYTMSMGITKLSGVISARQTTKDNPANFTMTVSVGGLVTLATLDAYVEMTGNDKMSLMFDVSSLLTIIRAAGTVTGNSNIKALTSILESYDGMCAGFALDRTKK